MKNFCITPEGRLAIPATAGTSKPIFIGTHSECVDYIYENVLPSIKVPFWLIGGTPTYTLKTHNKPYDETSGEGYIQISLKVDNYSKQYLECLFVLTVAPANATPYRGDFRNERTPHPYYSDRLWEIERGLGVKLGGFGLEYSKQKAIEELKAKGVKIDPNIKTKWTTVKVQPASVFYK